MATTGFKGSGATAPLYAAAFRRYRVALNRYLKCRVKRPEDIEDLTQEIFELFVRKKGRPEVVRNPLAYLFRIAFHVVGDTLGEAHRDPVTFDSELLSDEITMQDPRSSGEEAEELVVQGDVLAALAKLPTNCLMALMLVEGQGMSYKEAAQAAGLSPNTIAVYVMQGRAALKLALDDHWNVKDLRK